MKNDEKKNGNDFSINTEIFELLTQNSFDVISILADDGTIKFESSAIERITGYKAPERLGRSVFEFVHPEDVERVFKEFSTRDKKTKKVEFRFSHKNGNWIWLEAIGQNFLDNPTIQGILVNYRDISEQKAREKILKLRENYLAALNSATEKLQTGELKTQLQKFIETIGKAAHANRTYIFKNHKNKQDKLLLCKIAEYAASGINPEIDNQQLQNLAYTDLPRWKKILSKGNIINGRVADFPQIEKDILQPQNIKAILIIPIMIGKEFWGFIGFDNCINDNEWQKTEIEFLKASAQKISFKIEKQREQKLLVIENKRFSATMDSIDVGLYVADMQTYELLYVNKYAEKLFEGPIGKKCYVALQGLEKPCKFCTNKKLLDKNGKPKKPYVWEFKNKITKQWYQCSDQAIEWTDGRLVRMEIATDITDRKKAEKALKKSEEKHKLLSNQFQLMSDNIPDFIWAKDLDSNYTFVNKAMCDKLLIAENTQEPIGKNDLFFAMRQRNLHPEKKDWHTFGELCINSDDVAIKSKKTEHFEEYGNVQGAFLYLDVYKSPIFDKAGKIVGTVGHGRIVTKEKAAEKALKDSEDRLSKTMKAVNDGLWDWNLTTNKVYFDPRYYQMAGYEPNEFPYTFEEFQKRIHPDDINFVLSQAQKHIKGETERFLVEFRFKKKNGDWLWVMGRGLIVERDKDKKPLQFIGTHTDISERKRVEKDLKLAKEKAEESEYKVRSMFENTQIGILYCNAQGQILEINQVMLDILGSPSREATLKTINLLTFKPLQENGFAQNVEKCIVEKIIVTEDTLYTSKWGKTIFMKYYLVPVILNNKVIGVWGNFNNLTNLWNTQNQLKKAKEKAQESDRLKSAFLANMSHEIRTPMNGILGFSELLKEPELSGDKQYKYIEIIEKSGKRMLNIINDIVDISKIEAGLMEFHIQETNVNEQLEYTYTFFKPEAKTKGIALSYKKSFPTREATIKTDREKLYAILTNLVKNAIKYTDEGAIEFGYNLKKNNEASELEFYVKDTGIGIPKERQEAIFDRFIQADIANRAQQGAGLGLAITKAYIEKLGGKIWVESNEGNLIDGREGGSTFYFTLPYNSELAQKIDSQPASSEKYETIRKLKILIAEDDQVSELLINEIIKNFSKEILKAKTGIEAVEICRNNSDIDLVLMDIRMPEINGYAATKQIRKFNQKVIIIAQTAYGLSSDRKKAIEVGCNGYISKPIKKAELQAIMQKYFGKSLSNEQNF